MKIKFPNRQAINSVTGGISFPAVVNGNKIRCEISREALQDISPENRASFEDI